MDELSMSYWVKCRPQIKPSWIANRYKFSEILGEDCDPLKYFSFNEYSFIYYFFNHLKLILYFGVMSNNLWKQAKY